MDKDLRKSINDATRATMNPAWQDLVKAKADAPMSKTVIVPGTRIAAGNPPAAKAGNSTRKLSGGVAPVDLYRAEEFGTKDREKTKTYTRKNTRNGGSHQVTRRTRRQLPAYNAKGRVAYPAFAQLAPRMASLWAQIVVKKTHEAFEKGSN
jgi:hypothetical protein